MMKYYPAIKKNQNLMKWLCEWILRTLFLEKEKKEHRTSYILSDSMNKKCPEQWITQPES